MARRNSRQPDPIDSLLYVLFVTPHDSKELGVSSFRGYKREYLSQNLSEMEIELIICPVCDGIMREASIYDGNVTCNMCSFNKREAKPVNNVKKLVDKLEIKCPMMEECDWTGNISEVRTHSHMCRSVHTSCPLGCEQMVKRFQINEHIKNECSLRISECEFCGKLFSNHEMENHLNNCSLRPLECGCGSKLQMCNFDKHIETECPLAEVECPYAKYSCHIGKLQRKDLLAHKQEFYIEHQGMLEERHINLEEKHLLLDKRSKKLEKENEELRNALKTKRDLDGLTCKINFKRKKPKIETPIFKIAYNDFKCSLRGTDPMRVSIKRLLFGPGSYGSLPISECRLFLDPTKLCKEQYFGVFKLDLKFAGGSKENVLLLERSIYSNYFQDDGTLIMRLYFA